MKSDANANIGSYANADLESNSNSNANSNTCQSDTAYYLWAFGIVVLFTVLTILAIRSVM